MVSRNDKKGAEHFGQFADNLRRLMKERNWTEADLAFESGVSRASLNHYLHASDQGKLPNLANLIAIALTLDCSLDELTGIDRLRVDTSKRPSKEHISLARRIAALPTNDLRRDLINSILFARDGSRARGATE